MQSKSLVVLSALCAVASAHFQLQYPAPRGVFVEKDETTFCGTYLLRTSVYSPLNLCSLDNYPNAVDNRTLFPLSGGTISLNSEHPIWSRTCFITTSSTFY